MGGLAVMLKEAGFQVTGSDQALYPPMSDFLRRKGIDVRLGYSPANLDPDVDLVVIGNALSRGNEEVEAVLERRIPYRSMPEVLRSLFLDGRKTIVVTGTHGKTTTASLTAWILTQAGLDPGFMIGGIPANFDRGAKIGKGDIFVVEGDEYDCAFFDKRPKFLHYTPWIVTLGSLEYDHADIYRDFRDMVLAYKALLRILPRNGRLIVNLDDPEVEAISALAPCPVVTCSTRSEAHLSAFGIQVVHAKTSFKVVYEGQMLGECSWDLPGQHNVMNALLALAACLEAGVDAGTALKAMSSFKGVVRRLESLGVWGGVHVYDDFAHHPTAIREGIKALRSLHPKARLWAIVEPRSNSMRRKVFEAILPDALAGADRVILSGVHRTEALSPEERLDPQKVTEMLKRKGVPAWYISNVKDIARFVSTEVQPGDVVCVMSNGGFEGLQDILIENLKCLRDQQRGWPG